jgi:hypothetical protein
LAAGPVFLPFSVVFFFALLMPVLYAFIGFIGGIIAGALCNVIAKWTGGLEFAVGDVVPAA